MADTSARHAVHGVAAGEERGEVPTHPRPDAPGEVRIDVGSRTPLPTRDPDASANEGSLLATGRAGTGESDDYDEAEAERYERDLSEVASENDYTGRERPPHVLGRTPHVPPD